jgi:hypothetical protein
LSNGNFLFTSESVTEGHPDKIADQISDAVLDAILEKDPMARVACETLVSTGLAVIAGEITTDARVDYKQIVRDTIHEIGYNDALYGYDANTCSVVDAMGTQSPDIAQGVDTGGAGDQGLMFGFACNETPELMPLPIKLAHDLTMKLSEVRRDGTLPYLRPDGKSQVTVEYRDGKPFRVEAVVVSSQHSDDVTTEQLRADITEKVIKPVSRQTCLMMKPNITSIRPAGSLSAAPWATPALPDARSSSTPTADTLPTAEVLSPARTRRRSTARPHTWPATSRKTSLRQAWLKSARFSLLTPSASLSPFRSMSIHTEPEGRWRKARLKRFARISA